MDGRGVKVLHVLGSAAPGGAQRLVLDVSAQLEQLGLRSRTHGTVFTFFRSGALFSDFEALGPTYFSPVETPFSRKSGSHTADRFVRRVHGRLQMVRHLPDVFRAAG